MNILDFLAANSIGGIDIGTLEEALHLATKAAGMLLNVPKGEEKIVLKCVSEYYTERTDNKKTQGAARKLDNIQMMCYKTKESLGIEAGALSCKECHQKCLERLKEGTLYCVKTNAANGRKRRR